MDIDPRVRILTVQILYFSTCGSSLAFSFNVLIDSFFYRKKVFEMIIPDSSTSNKSAQLGRKAQALFLHS